MRPPLYRRAHAALAAICLFATALPLFAQAVSAEDKQAVLKGVGEVLTEKAFVPGIDLAAWPAHLAKKQEAIDAAPTQGEFVRLVNQALRDFGCSHMRLRTPKQADAQRTATAIGIGVSARMLAQEKELEVNSLSAGAPAEEAGLQPGDRIVLVDGQPPAASSDLAGDEGTEVTLLLRGHDGLTREVTLTRTRFSTAKTDTLTWLDDSTCVLKIHTFNVGYDRKKIENLMREAAKADRLILDLRNNGGGRTNNLQHLLTLLLPPNTAVGTFISRKAIKDFIAAGEGDGTDLAAVATWWDRKMKTRRTSDPEPFKGHIAVLINQGSASASEIVAAGLHDTAGAPLVGQRSAGAVLKSVYAKLHADYALQYAIEDYLTIKGTRLEGNPLQPDVKIAGGKGSDEKTIKAAWDVLKGSKVEEDVAEKTPEPEPVAPGK